MPRSGIFLEATINLLNSVGQSALANLRLTQEELRTDTFSVSKSVGRYTSLWLDAMEALPTALAATGNGPLPTLFAVVHPGDTTVTRYLQAMTPANRALEFTGLEQVGGTARFDSRTVKVEPTGTNVGINLKLIDLDPEQPAGTYQGIVHVDDSPLAVIIVKVTARKKSGSGTAE